MGGIKLKTSSRATLKLGCTRYSQIYMKIWSNLLCMQYCLLRSTEDNWLLSRKAMSWRILVVDTNNLTSIPPSTFLVIWSLDWVVGSSLPLMLWEAWELSLGSLLPGALLAGWRWAASALLAFRMTSPFRHCCRSTCWFCCFVWSQSAAAPNSWIVETCEAVVPVLFPWRLSTCPSFCVAGLAPPEYDSVRTELSFLTPSLVGCSGTLSAGPCISSAPDPL